MRCNMCGGEAALLGTLGDIEHWRCRDCGWDRAVSRDPDDGHDDSPPAGLVRTVAGAAAFTLLLYVDLVLVCAL